MKLLIELEMRWKLHFTIITVIALFSFNLSIQTNATSFYYGDISVDWEGNDDLLAIGEIRETGYFLKLRELDGQKIKEFRSISDSYSLIEWGPAGDQIGTTFGHHGIQVIIDPKSDNSFVIEHDNLFGRVSAMKWNHDGSKLIIVTNDANSGIFIYDSSSQLISQIYLSNVGFFSVDWSYDSQYYATSFVNGTLVVMFDRDLTKILETSFDVAAFSLDDDTNRFAYVMDGLEIYNLDRRLTIDPQSTDTIQNILPIFTLIELNGFVVVLLLLRIRLTKTNL